MTATAEKILAVEVTRQAGQAVVTAEGEVDLSAAPIFREALRNAEAMDEPQILVDLTRVTYMDSSGVYALLDLYRSYGERADGIRLRVGDGPAGRVIQLARLDSIIPVEGAVN
jgi:anti-anti-sigma factor